MRRKDERARGDEGTTTTRRKRYLSLRRHFCAAELYPMPSREASIPRLFESVAFVTLNVVELVGWKMD